MNPHRVSARSTQANDATEVRSQRRDVVIPVLLMVVSLGRLAVGIGRREAFGVELTIALFVLGWAIFATIRGFLGSVR